MRVAHVPPQQKTPYRVGEIRLDGGWVDFISPSMKRSISPDAENGRFHRGNAAISLLNHSHFSSIIKKSTRQIGVCIGDSMNQFESRHYIFHFGEATKAERDIESIAAYQESCFQHICAVLGVTPEFKIEYYLCDSPEGVGRIYGDNDPCNGFAALPNKVYAVYNEQIQCIGFHEDAHLISYVINRPDCPAIREGLAMYFDRKWWGIQNMDWVGFYLKTGRYIPVNQLLDKEYFFFIGMLYHISDHGCLY